MTGQGASPVYAIEPLGKQDRTGFSCGVAPLDAYIQTQAGQDARKRVAAPFVLVERGKDAVLGYYTLSSMGAPIGDWPPEVARQLPRYPHVPVTLLGRLAVDQRLRGSGLGGVLLADALKRSLQASRHVASVAVIADAKDDQAEAFYLKQGFLRFPELPRKVFLPMKTIEKLFSEV